MDTSKKILEEIEKSDEPITAYEISKRLGISWYTVCLHCFRMLSENKISKREIVDGAKKYIVWYKKKNERKGKKG